MTRALLVPLPPTHLCTCVAAQDQKEVDELTSQVAELRAALRRIENGAVRKFCSRAVLRQ